MRTKLKQYYPMIWEREELIKEIEARRELSVIYQKWEKEQQSDTGLELELLQKFLFVPLDIFRRKMQNKAIKDKLEAWLLFFSSDDPEDVMRLTEEYPEFHAMYEQGYEICRNVENVMGIFSEELRILDRNTVQLMIDEMQDTIDSQKDTIDSQKKQMKLDQSTITAQKDMIDSLREEIARLQAQSKRE